jgi:hypothetical protein
VDLNNLLDFGPYTTVPLCWKIFLSRVLFLFVCDLRTQYFLVICGTKLFADLKRPQVRKYILFLLTKIAYSSLSQISTNLNIVLKPSFRTVLRQSCAVFVEICGLITKTCIFAICGLAHLTNFADLQEQNEPKQFADLKKGFCPPLHIIRHRGTK